MATGKAQCLTGNRSSNCTIGTGSIVVLGFRSVQAKCKWRMRSNAFNCLLRCNMAHLNQAIGADHEFLQAQGVEACESFRTKRHRIFQLVFLSHETLSNPSTHSFVFFPRFPRFSTRRSLKMRSRVSAPLSWPQVWFRFSFTTDLTWRWSIAS